LPVEIEPALGDRRNFLNKRALGGYCGVTNQARVHAWQSCLRSVRNVLMANVGAHQAFFNVCPMRKLDGLDDRGPNPKELSDSRHNCRPGRGINARRSLRICRIEGWVDGWPSVIEPCAPVPERRSENPRTD